MKTGIYKIYNTLNGECYIGSSKNIDRRIKQHFASLKNNKSHSTILQQAINTFGIDNFSYEILELCDVKDLFTIEQKYVDEIDPKYNTCKVDVSVPTGLPYKDKELRKKLAQERLINCENFGWKSRKIAKLDENNNIIKEYNSLTEYAEEHDCSIGNVGKALKKGNRCKGFYIIYL